MANRPTPPPPAPYLARLLGDLGVPPDCREALARQHRDGAGLAYADADTLAATCGRTGAPAWARRIVAALRLARYCGPAMAGRAADRCQGPRDVAAIVRAEIGGSDQERFLAVLLDPRQRVLAVRTIHVGALSEVHVHPREVFRPAIRLGAHSIVVAHNHPSGCPEPSTADVDLQARLGAVAETIGIPIMDHLVVAGQAHVSMAARGLL